ncbi:MAG TPA: SRPBCC family protein [Kofleriaceae bacterium]|nr:SRPBCC family protein [Kofleriaceae bacterium]
MSETDRIEKRIVLKATQSRVWRALSDAKEFGAWFGCAIEGAFEAGRTMKMRITKPAGYEHIPFAIVIDRIEPETLFSYRWHPYAIDPNHDYSKEPMTLVEMRLTEKGGATELVIVESGFDKIPAERRAEALKMNTGGWGAQAENLRKYVEA